MRLEKPMLRTRSHVAVEQQEGHGNDEWDDHRRNLAPDIDPPPEPAEDVDETGAGAE